MGTWSLWVILVMSVGSWALYGSCFGGGFGHTYNYPSASWDVFELWAPQLVRRHELGALLLGMCGFARRPCAETRPT